MEKYSFNRKYDFEYQVCCAACDLRCQKSGKCPHVSVAYYLLVASESESCCQQTSVCKQELNCKVSELHALSHIHIGDSQGEGYYVAYSKKEKIVDDKQSSVFFSFYVFLFYYGAVHIFLLNLFAL